MATLDLSAGVDWKGTFSNLPVNSNGEKIKYSLTEEKAAGYNSEVTGSAEDGFTVTNTVIPGVVIPPVVVNPPAVDTPPAVVTPSAVETPPAAETQTPSPARTLLAKTGASVIGLVAISVLLIVGGVLIIRRRKA